MDNFSSFITQAIVDSGGTIDEKPAVEELIDQEIGAREVKEEPKTVEKPIVPEHKEPVFDLTVFNKKFSKEFDSEDSLVQAIEKASKYGELESKLGEISTKYTEIEERANKAESPLKWFKNTDEYVRQQFLINNGDKYTPEALNVLTKLTPSSIDKMNAWEVLKTDLLISNDIEGGEAAVNELLMDKYGVDSDNWDEFDQKTRNSIKLDSKAAKSNLKSVFDGIELPREVDFATSRKQLEEVWQSPLQEIVKGIDKIKLADGIDFAVSDDLKVGLLEETMNEILKGQLSPNKETGSQIASAMRTKILERSMDKIVAHIRSTVDAELRSEYRSKVENTEPLNTGSGLGQSDDTSEAISWLLQ